MGKSVPLIFGVTLSIFAALPCEGRGPSMKKATPRSHVQGGSESSRDFEPFTGQLTRSKVRLRLGSNLDSGIVRELDRNEMLVIVGETDDFYAVQPSSSTRGYVYRSYVLDDVIEGTRVNVRMEPDINAPILTQLNTGDPAKGQVSALNSKWVEIPVPSSVTFYVAKEFIDRVGDSGHLARMTQRASKAKALLDDTYTRCLDELKKPFKHIQIDQPSKGFEEVIRDFSDFPLEVSQAREMLAKVREAYTEKKIAYLESKAQRSTADGVPKSLNGEEAIAAKPVAIDDLDQALDEHRNRIDSLEKRLEGDEKLAKGDKSMGSRVSLSDKKASEASSASWEPVESALYDEWAQDRSMPSKEEFYAHQHMEATKLHGIITKYGRPIKNRPGDYVVVDKVSKRPVAFLYSTALDLDDAVDREVTVTASPRPNNNFAFPAYYALSME